jgi:hypothetical protein
MPQQKNKNLIKKYQSIFWSGLKFWWHDPFELIGVADHLILASKDDQSSSF